MELVKHETCQQYFDRRISEGWKCISLEGHNAILLSPDDNILRPVDLRNDVDTIRPNSTTVPPAPGAGYNYVVVDATIHGALSDADDASYVRDQSYGPAEDRLTFHCGLADPPYPSGTINKITAYWRVRSKAGWGLAELSLRIGGVKYIAFASFNVPSVYTNKIKEYETNPATEVVWTWADINALRIGAELNGRLTVNGNEWSDAYDFWVEVDYTPTALYYHGLKVQGVGELALCDVGNHPLRVRKGGTTYGIELVDIADGNALPIRIKTPAGIKAIRKYT